MASPIAQLRDDFANNTVDPAWGNSGNLGFGAYSETGGQAVCTLPSSTAGSHQGAYQTSGTYDLTSDQFVWNIATMVATGVAATAYFQLMNGLDGRNQLYWQQVSNAITCRVVQNGVDTQLFTATWSATTYKYLRIRESGGTTFWDSSTNGTTWTNRAALANPFAVTSLYVQFAAACGNVASPGSLKLDDVNLILPAVSSTWRWTQVEWPLLYRFRPMTLAIDTVNTVQGYIAVSSSIDSSGNLVSPVYYSGPLGSASGGYNALTLVASQAAAQAMAVNLPLDGRWDLPSIVECRFIRLYHRSLDASSHTYREYYPRRIVQADDIEAESIRAINIAAGAITADKIFVLNLAAVSAFIGQLSIDPTGWIYQGSGTGAAPATGLKIFNSGGIGKLSTYNAGVEQVTFDTDGKLKAGAGAVQLDATGIKIAAPTAPVLTNAYGFTAGGVASGALYPWNTGALNAMLLKTLALSGQDSTLQIVSDGPSGLLGKLELFSSYIGGNLAHITMQSNAAGAVIAVSAPGGTTFNDGINIGTAISASTGQISTSSGVGFGVAAQSNIRMLSRGQDATSSNYALFAQDSAGATLFYVRNDGAVVLGKAGAGIGFYGAGPATKPTVTGSRAANAALASLLTALAGLGILTDSST